MYGDTFHSKKRGGETVLGDDVQEKAVKLTYKGVTVTAKTIDDIIRLYLNRPQKQVYGKQSLKRLNRKGRTLDSIPVINQDLKGLQKELKKFGVDYSVRKSLTEKDTYEIYFKGSDINQIQTALKNYTAMSFQKNQNRDKPSIKERMKAAVQKAKERNQNLKQHERKFERGRDER